MLTEEDLDFFVREAVDFLIIDGTIDAEDRNHAEDTIKREFIIGTESKEDDDQ